MSETMERYKKVLLVLSIIIGLSIGAHFYTNKIAAGEPFVQGGVYGEFDYVKLSNREFTLYLTESNLHDRESLGWISADYQEIDVVVVIDGIEYERSMFCYKGESSELEVENVTIIFSYYMEENTFTADALFSGIMGALAAGTFSLLILGTVGELIVIRRRANTTAETQ